MEYQESGADAANSLADPNGFRYGAGASEGELTLPRASIAAFEVPQPANWHVHLELRPEELVALHKLGLTRGAIAWREGMAAWQPLRENQEPAGLGSEILGRAAMPSSSDLEPTIASPPSDWSDAVTVAAERAPETGSNLAPAGEDDNSVVLLSPRVRRATLPPTSPLFAAATRPHVAAVATPARSRTGGGSGSSFPPAPVLPAPKGNAAAPLGRSGTAIGPLPPAPRLPSFESADAPALATFPMASAPPTAFEPSGVRPGFKRSSLWLGAIGLAVVSAVLGSVVSGVFSKPSAAAEDVPAATSTAAIEAPATLAAKPGGLAPIPIDQLPVADTAARLAPAPAAAAPARDERRAERDESRSPSRAAAPESQADAAPREEPKSSALSAALAQAAAAGPSPADSEPESSRDDEASEAPSSTRASGGPDLKAIAKAVNTAARAASTCGASPQSGRVAITFSPSGAVRSVQMEQQFDERDVGSCVLRAMGRAKVAAFTGEPVTVRKSVSW